MRCFMSRTKYLATDEIYKGSTLIASAIDTRPLSYGSRLIFLRSFVESLNESQKGGQAEFRAVIMKRFQFPSIKTRRRASQTKGSKPIPPYLSYP